MTCIHNVWITCGEIHDCSTCGWDPDVQERRKATRGQKTRRKLRNLNHPKGSCIATRRSVR